MRIPGGVAVLTLLLVPVGASAQGSEAMHVLLAHVLVGGGAAVPVGAGAGGSRVGYQIQGALEVGLSGSPVNFRLEGLVDRLGFTYRSPCLAIVAGPCPLAHSWERRVAGTVDVVIQPRWGFVGARPYLIAGGGAYWHEHGDANGVSSYCDPGENVGVGVRVQPLHAFFEVRDHIVRRATDCLSITVGLRL